jgi:hypothetical protein
VGLAAKFSRMPSRNVVLGRQQVGVPWARAPVSIHVKVAPSSVERPTNSSASLEPDFAGKLATAA